MRLPPLNALRAFEAAARHQSFVRAAEELHVSQGAISRHVRLLEEQLGVALFRRRAQGIELTGPGRTLLPELTASLARIARAVRQVALSDRELRVATVPTFASRWLVRRLGRYQALHPASRVTLGLLWDFEEFFRGGFDVGIIDVEADRTRPERLESVLLRREAITPVCAPGVMRGASPLREPADLLHHVLLHPTPDRQDWRKWLRAAGLPEERAQEGQVFETLEMAISAALGGLGVAMADRDLVQDELATGRLVAPFELTVREETGYVLFAERGRLEEPRIAAFRDWLLAELAADEDG